MKKNLNLRNAIAAGSIAITVGATFNKIGCDIVDSALNRKSTVARAVTCFGAIAVTAVGWLAANEVFDTMTDLLMEDGVVETTVDMEEEEAE